MHLLDYLDQKLGYMQTEHLPFTLYGKMFGHLHWRILISNTEPYGQ